MKQFDISTLKLSKPVKVGVINAAYNMCVIIIYKQCMHVCNLQL